MARFLVTSDWHLRADKPRCRMDEDWPTFQMQCMNEVVLYSHVKQVPIMLIGDLFDVPNVPSFVVIDFLSAAYESKYGIHLLAGNHDLPYHSLENLMRSSMGIIWSLAGKSHHVEGLGDYGLWKNFGGEWEGNAETGIRFIHQLVFPSKKDIPPNVDAVTAFDLLEEYPDSRWIFTGDMHKAFHVEQDGRHVVNSGCLNRQAADFKDYQPKVALVNTATSEVDFLPISDPADMVVDSYLREEEAREDRIGAFVETLKKSGKVSLSFTDNLNEAMEKNKTALSSGTIEVIRGLMEA